MKILRTRKDMMQWIHNECLGGLQASLEGAEDGHTVKREGGKGGSGVEGKGREGHDTGCERGGIDRTTC